MKINKLKINGYGKLKEKEVNFEENINIIYGKNESGKSTILNFISNCFYGISKNKKGKEISDFEKYTPWVGEDFSGKLEYELDNQKKFEIFRDFKKKNPKIFNEKKEDISKEFNIDKNRGNEFFYEQTKIDEALFLSTIFVNQQEVKLEKQDQNVLIQKIANLVGTGEDNVSFKRAMDRIDRRRLEEIGTERSREKPINLISKEMAELEKEKQELEKYIAIKYEIEEKKNELNQEIENLENENKFLKETKLVHENEKIENEKIKLKREVKDNHDKKIKQIKNEIEEINSKNKNILDSDKKINSEKSKLNKKISIVFLFVVLVNIIQIIFIKNTLINCIFLLTVPVAFIYYFYSKNKINKKEIKAKSNVEKINLQTNNLENEINLLEKNKKELEDEINILQNNFNVKLNLEKEKIKNNYLNKIEKNKIEKFMTLENINSEIQNIESKINNKKIELHTLNLDHKNIEPRLENLSKIEEKLVDSNEKMVNLRDLERSMNLTKEVLNNSYNKMKNVVTPKFTEELSNMISEITNGKYTNVRLNDDTGLVVELDNGNYVPASRLSIGTIDQLYLSLRLAMAEKLSEEKMPIILDEAFAYYDTERLKNILEYIAKRFCDHQIMIYTCMNREKQILQELGISFHLIEI